MGVRDSYNILASLANARQNSGLFTPSGNASSSGLFATSGLKCDQFNGGTGPICAWDTTGCTGTTTGFPGGTGGTTGCPGGTTCGPAISGCSVGTTGCWGWHMEVIEVLLQAFWFT